MTTKKGGHAVPMQTRPVALTEEQKKAKIVQFLAQKREGFAITILQGLCTNIGKDATNFHAKMMVDLSVEMADQLLEKLYPLPKAEEAE